MGKAKHDPAEAFRQLTDPDAGTRLLGAKWLLRQSLAEMNRWTDEWLRHPDTVTALLPALADSDERVVEEAVGAAWGIATRYNRDARLRAPAISLLSSGRPRTRQRAAVIVSRFGAESFGYLLPLFSDPDKSVRAGVAHDVMHACHDWPEATRQQVRTAALALLGDRVFEVRCSAADLLRDVGEIDDLPALEVSLAGIKGVNYRQSFREAMQAIQDSRTKRCT